MTSIETRLEEAMRPGVATEAPVDGWQRVSARADQLERRDRLVQRVAVAAFVVGFGLLVVGFRLGGEFVADTAEGADATEATIAPRIRWEFLIPGIALVGVVVGAFVAQAARSRIPRKHAAGWRRWIFRLSIVPVLYGPAIFALGALVFASDSPSPFVERIALPVAITLKLFTVVLVPCVIFLLAEHLGRVRHRWRGLTLSWLGLGIGVVLIGRGLISDIVRLVDNHLWPEDLGHNNFTDQPQKLQLLDNPPGDDWTSGNILLSELLAVVAMALLCGLALRWLHQQAVLTVASVMGAVLLVATLYSARAPFAFAIDFDTYVSGIVLGGVLIELLVFPFPVDPIGALAISAATFSMVCAIWLWGGPIQPDPTPSETEG